ncbi:thiamine pyrophosphate-dependent dehydrogenase E1 component subunit alpha [Thermogemmatispora tikiterensis]|uniref:Pyruvate dehydrogenase (Acetyl-transferring) E1 component subunit alpha n=1 Tax=Thermogemmatispora tikiterensis TaxID=1825093 RepID=A0A328VQM6_9CHLR|nr:thiamine pyrophosphate-dependent dehydrogenase E1 component subunit alpha [Thermogemmatispora tikiterensis]RAQ96445.1 pyruvate dehydrogenase (acetyl-transferring) E1 component subunit alpha [Thermogemmatispora tikiterensis]
MIKPEPSPQDLQYLVAQAGLDADQLCRAYRQLCLIRSFENLIADRYYIGKTPEFNMAAGPIRGEMHLAVGQEAVAVGVCSLLGDGDAVVSTHRPHHHALAKGVEPKKLAAEIFGKASGLCHGKGGHMHLFDAGRHFACSGIVGASFPQAAGAAFAFRKLGQRTVAVAFAGEGAANHGTFAETLNVAGLFQLPLVVVIEDNLYADSTPKWAALSTVHHFQRAQSFNIPSYVVDGMDFIDVYRVAKLVIERARNGMGPALIEAVCYRYRGHFEGDAEEYRTREEVERWQALDPIPRLGERLKTLGWADEAMLNRLRDEAQQEAEAAIQFAESSPLPEPQEALMGVFQ